MILRVRAWLRKLACTIAERRNPKPFSINPGRLFCFGFASLSSFAILKLAIKSVHKLLTHSMARRAGRRKTRTLYQNIEAALRKINETNEVSDEDILKLFQINRLPCKGCCVNSRASPNCFCELTPSGGLGKSTSLWQEITDIEAMLGPDPRELLRSSMYSPSGLKNLWNTCYANSILQCLYRIKQFMQGFFAVEPELLERDTLLQNVALLFAELCLGRKKVVDPAPLAEALKLDVYIQEDANEFLKHFLILLSDSLVQSKNVAVKTLVEDVFKGRMTHEIKCSSCNQESLASKELQNFEELVVNVGGFSSLNESLDNLLSVEQLTEGNQYFCEFCNATVDATCFTNLRSLPPVLNFHLKRFVFDAKTVKQEKVRSEFSFPQVLDMTSRLGIDGSSGPHVEKSLLYDLSCVVIHKGSSTEHGHYVANIKDDAKGEWWEFDDELVTSLGSYPLRDISAKSPEKEIYLSGRKASSSQDASWSSAANTMSTSQTQTHEQAPDQFEDCLTSADAYILIYSQRESVNATRVSTNDIYIHIPDDLCCKIEAQNNNLLNKCLEYKGNLDKELSDRADRKKEIKTVSTKLSAQSQNNRYFWISSSWLQTWAAQLKPLSIDNSNLLCKHHKVSPSSVQKMKCISEEAWTNLVKKYGGGPELTAKECCIECVKDIAKDFALSRSLKSRRIKIKQLLGDAGVKDIPKSIALAHSFNKRRMEIKKMLGDAGSANQAGRFFLVSRAWLQNFYRRKSVKAPTEVDASPTAAITCPHKALLPNNYKGAQHQEVTKKVWDYFSEVVGKVQQKDTSEGCVSFPVGTPTCPICDTEMMEATSQQQDQKDRKMKERQKLEALFCIRNISIVPGATYHLVPTAWLHQWRSYLRGTGKKSQKAKEPLELENSLQNLCCEKHNCLLNKVPQLQRNGHGELVQKTLNDDFFTIVSEDHWIDFCSIWKVKRSLSIEAFVEIMTQVGAHDRSENVALTMGVSEGFEDYVCTQILITEPKVCRVCVKESESTELMRKLQYSSEESIVNSVDENQPPKAEEEDSDSIGLEPGFRGTLRSQLSDLDEQSSTSSLDFDVTC